MKQQTSRRDLLKTGIVSVALLTTTGWFGWNWLKGQERYGETVCIKAPLIRTLIDENGWPTAVVRCNRKSLTLKLKPSEGVNPREKLREISVYKRIEFPLFYEERTDGLLQWVSVLRDQGLVPEHLITEATKNSEGGSASYMIGKLLSFEPSENDFYLLIETPQGDYRMKTYKPKNRNPSQKESSLKEILENKRFPTLRFPTMHENSPCFTEGIVPTHMIKKAN